MSSGIPPLACADFTFPLLPHEHSLQLIAMLGFDAVDIGLFEERSHLWPSREFANLRGNADRLRKCLDAQGLACADVFLQMALDFADYAINHPEPGRRKKARDWFSRTLEYAAAVGSGHVTILPGVDFSETESREDSWNRTVEELAWRVQEGKRQGIAVSVEAHVGSIASTPEDALLLVQDVEGLTLTLDYTHFAKIGLSDARVEPLLEHASHFHVRGARRDRLQASFADNVIDYARVVERMKATGYSGAVGIEYTWIDWEHCNEVDNVSETILFRDFIRECFANPNPEAP